MDNAIKTLSPAKQESESNITFSNYLVKFIAGRTNDENEQKKMMEIAVEQFSGNTDKIKPNCFKCYGRGHLGYNSTHEYYVPCPVCFKNVH